MEEKNMQNYINIFKEKKNTEDCDMLVKGAMKCLDKFGEFFEKSGHKTTVFSSSYLHYASSNLIEDNSKFLVKNYPHGNIDDFFISYKELAHMGRDGATEFELATCEMFKKIFHMEAKHVGPKGNTPDVFVESKECGFCGIIDNKAYAKGYSISGDHKRVMEHVYIPEYKKYGETALPLAFYSYIAGSFKKNIELWTYHRTCHRRVVR